MRVVLRVVVVAWQVLRVRWVVRAWCRLLARSRVSVARVALWWASRLVRVARIMPWALGLLRVVVLVLSVVSLVLSVASRVCVPWVPVRRRLVLSWVVARV